MVSDEYFEKIMSQVLEKLADSPGSYTDRLKQIAKKYIDSEHHKEIQNLIIEMNESVDFISLVLKYMMFDVEATRRELSASLEEKNDD